MKVVVYGAGVIGCSYGWLLARAGCQVTLLVRPENRVLLERKRLTVSCTDFRSGKKEYYKSEFCPDVISSLSPDHTFDYILVSVQYGQLSDILPYLSRHIGRAHVLFFMNLWDNFTEIAQFLPPEKYFFGFPFMLGGRKSGAHIEVLISGMKQAGTLLGESDGSSSSRIKEFARLLETAHLKPLVSTDIRSWLTSHFVIATCLSSGIEKSGGTKAFLRNRRLIRETICAIRRGFRICRANGFDPYVEKSNRFYNLPFILLCPVLRKVFSSEVLTLMFDAHIRNSPDEIRLMLAAIFRIESIE